MSVTAVDPREPNDLGGTIDYVLDMLDPSAGRHQVLVQRLRAIRQSVTGMSPLGQQQTAQWRRTVLTVAEELSDPSDRHLLAMILYTLSEAAK
jgi:hypothetical protein